MTGRRLAVLVAFLFACPGIGRAELAGAQKAEYQRKLADFLLNKKLVSKVTFPAWKDGVDLKIDGSWDQKWVTRQLKDHGVGIEIGDAATVTDVKMKRDGIEIHLNGGGFGTFGDVMMSSDAKMAARDAVAGKKPGGSRINLHFGRDITEADINNLEQLAKYIEPLVDTSSLQQAIMLQLMSAEYRDAAARGEILKGMDKPTVFAILGDPKAKNVDISHEPPVEKWQYEKNLKITIITSEGGKVAKIETI